MSVGIRLTGTPTEIGEVLDTLGQAMRISYNGELWPSRRRRNRTDRPDDTVNAYLRAWPPASNFTPDRPRRRPRQVWLTRPHPD